MIGSVDHSLFQEHLMRATEPSDRNYLIFCDVEFAGRSLRSVAEEQDISPTRVQQIVAEMRAWFIASTPEWVRDTDPDTAPMHACRFHHERLQHLYSLSMQAWRASQTDVTTTRVRPGVLDNGEVRVTQRCFGQPRYLTTALQLSRAQIDAAERLNAICDKRDARAAAAAHVEAPREEACAPCAPEIEEAPQVAEREADIVTLTLDAAIASVDPVSLPLTTCVASHPAPTPVRSRKQQRKFERHQRRAAMRKHG
jgi:hypothetical protein